jgi:hypothetical protein
MRRKQKNKFLDLLINITRNKDKSAISVFQKLAITDTTIHYISDHPIGNKQATFICLLNRIHRPPLSQESKKQEMNTILKLPAIMVTHFPQ